MGFQSKIEDVFFLCKLVCFYILMKLYTINKDTFFRVYFESIAPYGSMASEFDSVKGCIQIPLVWKKALRGKDHSYVHLDVTR